MKATNCHFPPGFIMAPTEQIGINVIGAGGTGSMVLNTLARMNLALMNMEHPGLFVTAIDGDKIAKSNVGKQLYYNEDIGHYKAQVLIERINLNTGFNWEYKNVYFPSSRIGSANITIACIDKIQPRIDLVKSLRPEPGKSWRHKREVPAYYIDCGNSFDKGQVICQTVQPVNQPGKIRKYKMKKELPGFMDVFDEKTLELAKKEEDIIPSCSTHDALMRQDFFINPMMAFLACRIVWNIVFNKMILQNGYFISLDDEFAVSPLNV